MTKKRTHRNAPRIRHQNQIRRRTLSTHQPFLVLELRLQNVHDADALGREALVRFFVRVADEVEGVGEVGALEGRLEEGVLRREGDFTGRGGREGEAVVVGVVGGEEVGDDGTGLEGKVRR